MKKNYRPVTKKMALDSFGSLGDELQISKLTLDEAGSADPSMQWSQTQQAFLTPTNNSFAQSIEFDTSQGAVMQSYKDAYLAVPIVITGTSGQNFAARPAVPAVAFKGSVLSLVQGVNILAMGNQPATIDSKNDGTLPYSSHFRLLTQKGHDWEKKYAPLIHFSLDRAQSGVVGLTQSVQYAPSSIAQYVAAPAQGSPTGSCGSNLSDVYNVGFAERASFLLRDVQIAGSGVGGNTMKMTAIIPLRYLHPFFEKLQDTVLPSVNFKFSFFLQSNQGMIMSVGSAGGPNAVGTATAQTVDAIGPVSVSIDTSTIGPRLYYKSILAPPALANEISRKLSAGMTKSLFCETFDFYNYNNVANGQQLNLPVAQAISNVKRLWVACYGAGKIGTQSYPSPLITGQNYFTNVQLSINGESYNTLQFISPWELYEQFVQCLKDDSEEPSGQVPGYQQWLQTNCIMCFDLTRYHHKIKNANSPQTLTFSAKANFVETCDVIFIIERAIGFDFHISSSVIEVKPKNLLYPQ